MSHISYVYAIRAVGTNRVKIGTTKALDKRKAGLQTGCPYPIEVVATWEGGKEFEAALHKELAQFHAIGEWYEVEEWVIGWKAWRIQLSPPAVSIPPATTRKVKSSPTPSLPISQFSSTEWRVEWKTLPDGKHALVRRLYGRAGSRFYQVKACQVNYPINVSLKVFSAAQYANVERLGRTGIKRYVQRLLDKYRVGTAHIRRSA